MRAGALVVLLLLAVAGCGGSTPAANRSPIASTASPGASAGGSATPSARPSSAPSPTTGPASLVRCTRAVPAGDTLVIGTVVGNPTVVVRDIQDPANARTLCTFDGATQAQQFVSAGIVAYETLDHKIVEASLSGGPGTIVASYTQGFDSGLYAFSPDGGALTYINGHDWHLASASSDRVLTTMPALPGRGVSATQDDEYLAFSSDGQYVAWFQTFRTGGTGATAPGQIRKVSDGSLVYSASGMTMAVWASVPSRLFFRDMTGAVKRWDATEGVTSMTTLQWIRPRASPDGRWIAYTFPTSTGVGRVGLYSVQANSVSATTPAGRSGVRFLTNDLVFYVGERACSTCFGGLPQPTGVSYIYSIAGGSEVISRLASVNDVWPRTTAPSL